MSNMKEMYTDFTTNVEAYTAFIREASLNGDLDEMLYYTNVLRREIIRVRLMSS
jgi:hypothetical protein